MIYEKGIIKNLGYQGSFHGASGEARRDVDLGLLSFAFQWRTIGRASRV